MNTPIHTMSESGTDRNRGRGYPLENRRMRVRILNSACGESGRRALEEFDIDVVDVVAVTIVVESASSLFLSAKVVEAGD